MAAILTRRPLLTSAASLTLLGTAYYLSRPGHAQPATFSSPRTMLFSQDLTLLTTHQINHDTKLLTFSLSTGPHSISGIPAASALLTQHTPSQAWLPVLRPYTPISSPSEPGKLQLLVKKYPNGRASSHLHSLTPGQTLTVRGPLPGTIRIPPETKDVILIAGGAGVTPIFSLAKNLLTQPTAETEKTRIHFLWGVNSMRDLVLKSELDELEKSFPERLRVTYAVSGTSGVDVPDSGKFRRGYVDERLLRDVVGECRKNSGSWGGENGSKGQRVFLCGPPGMEEALAGNRGVLSSLGVERRQVHRF